MAGTTPGGRRIRWLGIIMQGRGGSIRRRTAFTLIGLLILGAGPVLATGVKMICASPVVEPLLVDGQLDEPAWNTAEIHDDFLDLATPRPQRTTMRLLYDRSNLYLGVECGWENVNLLKDGIAGIIAKHPDQLGFVHIRDFVNAYGIEVFLDPGASMVNSYQILANAAGQFCGRFKDDWDPFPIKPYFKTVITENGWTGEFVFPIAAFPGARIHDGEEWGINLVRNDKAPSVIWRQTGGAFYEPKRYGRLILGDYPTWWHAKAEVEMFEFLASISNSMDSFQQSDSDLVAMYRELLPQIEVLKEKKRSVDLRTRAGFLKLYDDYLRVDRLFRRFDALYTTIQTNNSPTRK